MISTKYLLTKKEEGREEKGEREGRREERKEGWRKSCFPHWRLSGMQLFLTILVSLTLASPTLVS